MNGNLKLDDSDMSHSLVTPEHSIAFTQVIFGMLVFLVGDITSLVVSMAAVILLDYTTGVAAACLNGKWSTKISLRGILIKFGFFAIVGGAYHIGAVFGAPLVFRKIFIAIFIAHEFGSILENVAKFDDDTKVVPKPVHKLARQLVEKAE